MKQARYIIAPILVFFSTLIYAQSGWFWQNPLPQGNHLYDIESLTGLTISVGSDGTILSSTGSGWQIRDAGVENYLFSISMKGVHVWVSGSDGTMLHNSDGVGYLWEEQTTGVDKQLRSVFFLNDNIGWSVGEQETILKTTDGGNNWDILYTNGSQHYFEVFFHDDNNGWLCGAAGSNGVIKKTTNGGTTWQNSIIPASRMNGMHFADMNFGCAVGNGGAIFRTTNGGTDWSLATSNTSQDLKAVYLKTNGEGWAVGYEGTIIFTSDFGATWNTQTSPSYNNLNAIYGNWVVGEGGTILHTTNGGTNWEKSFIGFSNWLTEIDFVNNSIGYTSGLGGKVYRTEDGGYTWDELSVGSSLDLYAIDFKEWQGLTGAGYTVGEANGLEFTVYRTTDGGGTWLDKSFTIPGVSNASNIYNCYRMLGTNFIVGRYGLIARTTDGGDNWDIQKLPQQSFDLWGIDFESENVGWVCGSSGTILKTTTKGDEWFSQNPDNVSNFRSIYFADLQHGWVVGVGGIIYRTTDGGYNWTKTTPNVTFERLNSVYFADQNIGWICGASGTILRSTNGGVDWYIQESGTDNELTSLSFTETGVGWISGRFGTILHTDDGGGGLSVNSFWKNYLNLSLADPGETTDDMDVIVDPELLNSFSLSGISVVLDTILHSNVTDLAILLSHNGLTDTLVVQPTNAGSNFIGCTLTDASSVPVDESQPPFTGIYKPHSPLSVFSGIDPNGIWTLKIIDLMSGNTGTLEAWGLKLYFDTPSDVKSDYSSIPNNYEVYQNFPNPFNPNTTIKWQQPETGLVNLKIYDVLGRELTTLVNEELSPGKHEVVFDASRFSSGIYFYQLKAGKYIETKKMVLIK
ncbi:MAG: T9SS type A sorting domain-containing protein [Ignavibacteriaceae bacterium]|nr:T9SS type A sorting domain-containing protein [Ignavibacteriaceae bacterium]